MFNKFGFLLVCVFALVSGVIYANEDIDVSAKEYGSDSSLCMAAAEKASADYGVNLSLLQTISAVESGQWSATHNVYMAWPWTVNAKGKGYYFATKEEAIAAAKKFIAQGITSIDVGCMQVNMKYHGKAFTSIEEAMDPENNMNYSAKFLRSLYKRNGKNWKAAAKKYHSGNPKEGLRYTQRLEKRFHAYKLAGIAKSAELF
ncbi:MAG: transglycosylase SLT domain-containing protein [Alphaproteobacteria bacterium]|nr:transglycosylase SLT domain-containing protein [Alphaproteobacteria bacterium]